MTETVTAQVPTTPPAADTPPALPSFMEIVPEAYRQEPWVINVAKNEKPYEAFFEQHKHAQSMIGRKSNAIELPGDDATAEQLSAFHKALGVPETVDGYKYEAPDVSKEPEEVQHLLKEIGKDQEFMKHMQAEAHKLGITPKQYAGLTSAMDAKNIEQARGLIEGAKAQGEQRVKAQTEALKQQYGDKTDTVVAKAKEIVAKIVPEAIRNMKDNELALVVMAQYMQENLFKSDSISPPTGTAPTTQTAADVRKEIVALINSKVYNNFTEQGHEAAKARAKELYILEDNLKKGKLG